MFFIFVGELLDLYPLLLLSLAGLIASVVAWLWPSKQERERTLAGDSQTLHGLPVYLQGTQNPAWWAMALSLLVFAVALGLLGFAYYYLRAGAEAWPPAGMEKPNLLLGAAGVALVVASAGPMLLAERGIRGGHQGRLVLGLALTFGLGVAALGVQFAELSQAGFTHTTNAYGSIFFLLAWFGTLLVLGGLVINGVVQIQAWLGYFNRWRYLAVQNAGLYWYFTGAAWVVIYAVAYVSPYLL
jgi:heme/copper-type cytochrome/quinol oxidase subunit 3